jgi:hypothetical protein
VSKISLDKVGQDPRISEVPSSDLAGEQTGSCTGSTASQSASHKPTVADVLRRHGLWLTRREMREEMAQSLEADGFTLEQVDKVCSYVLSMASDVRMGCGELVNLLRDRKRLQQAVEDIQQLRGRAHPGEADRQRTARQLEDERRQWADADRQHYIRCRQADGIPEQVAEAEWAAAHGRSK